MADSLTDFVLRLAEDPQSLKEFHQAPQRMMSEAGLSQAEQDVLNSKDPGRIKRAIASDEGAAEKLATTFVITAVIVIHTGLEEETVAPPNV